MVQKDFLEKTALVCGLPLPAVEEVFHAMTSVLGGALAEGETADLSATFGKFTPQLRVQKLAPNSPPDTEEAPLLHLLPAREDVGEEASDKRCARWG